MRPAYQGSNPISDLVACVSRHRQQLISPGVKDPGDDEAQGR
jgi:hypothetical protein